MGPTSPHKSAWTSRAAPRPNRPRPSPYVWESGDKKITVFFNKQDKVVNKRSEGL